MNRGIRLLQSGKLRRVLAALCQPGCMAIVVLLLPELPIVALVGISTQPHSGWTCQSPDIGPLRNRGNPSAAKSQTGQSSQVQQMSTRGLSMFEGYLLHVSTDIHTHPPKPFLFESCGLNPSVGNK